MVFCLECALRHVEKQKSCRGLKLMYRYDEVSPSQQAAAWVARSPVLLSQLGGRQPRVVDGWRRAQCSVGFQAVNPGPTQSGGVTEETGGLLPPGGLRTQPTEKPTCSGGWGHSASPPGWLGPGPGHL